MQNIAPAAHDTIGDCGAIIFWLFDGLQCQFLAEYY